MMRIIVILLLLCLSLYAMFNLGLLLPRTKITLKAIDENGKPIDAAKASATFEVLGGNNSWTVVGSTNKNGLATLSKSSTGNVGFSIEKEGYYVSGGAWHANSRSMHKWQPWNPEIKVTLRKIIKPVPMYARSTKMSKMEIPIVSKAIGFDLIEYDWMPPYGHGKNPDFIFEVNRNYNNEDEYSCLLNLSFSNEYDGIQLVSNEYEHSIFKLSRYAPYSNYNRKLTKHVSYNRKSGRQSDFNKEANYIFRVRSEIRNGKLVKAMYGKIRGEIEFYPTPRPRKIANFQFDYYLNPDYSNNLEFDTKQNLFQGLKSSEGLNLP